MSIFKEAILCECGGEHGGGGGACWRVHGHVHEVCMEVTGCWNGCVWGCVCLGVAGWVSDFWTSGIVYIQIYSLYAYKYHVINSIWPKSGVSEFWNNSSIIS